MAKVLIQLLAGIWAIMWGLPLVYISFWDYCSELDQIFEKQLLKSLVHWGKPTLLGVPQLLFSASLASSK